MVIQVVLLSLAAFLALVWLWEWWDRRGKERR